MMRETIKFLIMSQVIATSLIKDHLSKQNFTGGDIAQEDALVHLSNFFARLAETHCPFVWPAVI